MNLSTADLRNYRTEFHETWWSYRYMFLVDLKVFRFVVKGVKAIFLAWKFWKCRIAPLMVTYHYVKCYVSIIIHLEVIYINVRNFKFPIGFYSNPHPLWTPKNMALTPFTTNLKTLRSTRNSLPFSKWLPKHGIKMGGKNSTLSDIIKILYVGR
jgi:hypothetical protein